jgi:hypothetical protein
MNFIGYDHRMHPSVGDRGDTREEAGQRRPLDRAARLDHQRALAPPLRTDRRDSAGHLGQSDIVRAKIVVSACV